MVQALAISDGLIPSGVRAQDSIQFSLVPPVSSETRLSLLPGLDRPGRRLICSWLFARIEQFDTGQGTMQVTADLVVVDRTLQAMEGEKLFCNSASDNVSSPPSLHSAASTVPLSPAWVLPFQ